jgi:hypothetical protein
MKLTVSKSYVDPEGRVMAVTTFVPSYINSMPETEDDARTSEWYIQHAKDTSVVYEDQAAITDLITKRLHWRMLSDAFYDHDTVEVEIVDVLDKLLDEQYYSIENQSRDVPMIGVKRTVARILPMVEKPEEIIKTIPYQRCPTCGGQGFGHDVNLCAITHKSEIEKPDESDWDTVLTDAIVETQGSIKPYSRMLKYLNDNYTITKKP